MATKRKYNLADRRLIGLVCGIVAGISYGTNPLFAKPLMDSGVPVLVMLFFRYGISAFLLAAWMLVKKEKFRVRGRELGLLALLGVLFACSSIFLFASYTYIPSGLATTLVYLYPVFVALLMVFLRFYPSWQTWLSIAATFGGILLLSSPSPGAVIRVPGVILAILSALSYAFYLVIINRSGRIKHVSEHTLTLYALLAGMLLAGNAVDFIVTGCSSGQGMMLACNSFPGVLCGYAPTPADAYLFAQINNGNAVSLPLGEGYTWAGRDNLEQTIRQLFSEPFGQGYPKEEAARKLRDTVLLKELRAKSQTTVTGFLNSLDRELTGRILSKRNVVEYILANGSNHPVTDWIRKHDEEETTK